MAKEQKQAYLESRTEEVAELNRQLCDKISDLELLMEKAVHLTASEIFEPLKISEAYPPFLPRPEIATPKYPPERADFLSRVKPPTLIERIFRLSQRYEADCRTAEELFEAALQEHKMAEAEREATLAAKAQEHEQARQSYLAHALQRNQEVAEFEAAYREGAPTAVVAYSSIVLEKTEYPDDFPRSFRLAYSTEARELVAELDLPTIAAVPEIGEYRYVKSKDSIEERPRKPAERKEIYQDAVASVTLRTLQELFSADSCGLLDRIVFNGYVHSVDPATGRDVRPCVISVRAFKMVFKKIDLQRVDKRACLRNLCAQVSPQPQELIAVKPVVEFDMVDKRFVAEDNVLQDLESRPNLMDLSPTEFEHLVSNLFQRMGLDCKLTRASRDGGVDAVAFDTRPILGGKVVIQAKRYSDTVGVSAVRDLFGTMHNEGANKGILVTTSQYGTDSYEFAKDKPIELIDGGGLLYLLEQVGIRARIVMPDKNPF